MTSEQAFLCDVINHYGTGDHPMADTVTLPGFTRRYQAQVLLAAIDSQQLSEDGVTLAKSLLPFPMHGDRFRLRTPVDRFPDFVAAPGLTGTVIYDHADQITLAMDSELPHAEDFDNAIMWYPNEPEYGYTLEAFWRECEAI